MKSLLSPPVFDDDEQTRIARLLHAILLTFVLVGLLFMLPMAILSPAFAGRFLGLGLGFLIMSVGLLFMERRGRVRLASGLLVTILWGLATASAVTAGGVHAQVFVGGYLMIIVMTGLLLGGRASGFMAGLSALAGLGMVFAEMEGALSPPAIAPPPTSLWISNVSFFSVVVILQYLAARTIREALARARRELAERLEVETALRESEEKYRAIASQAGEAIFLFDGETRRVVEANEGFRRLLGYASDEIAGLSLFDFVADDRESIERNTQRVIAQKRINIGERPYRRKDGSVVTVEVNAHLISYGGRDVICAVVRDVTDRKRAEAALRESEALYRRAIEAAGAVPYYRDHRTNTYAFMGEGILQMTGYPASEMTPEVLDSLEQESYMRGEAASLSREEAIRRARAGELPEWRNDSRILSRDGKTRWLADSAVDVLDERGVAVGSIGILQDITERKQAEEALRESEELYRRAIEAAGAVPYYQDYATEAYTFMGEGIRHITGYGPHEITPVVWNSMVQESLPLSEGVNLSMEEAVRRARAGEMPVWKCDYRIRTRDGHIRWITDSAVEVLNERGPSRGSIGILQDVTGRKLIEAALAEQAAETATLYRASAQLLAPASDLKELAQRIAGVVVQEFELVECGIWLLVEGESVLRRVAYSGSAWVEDFEDIALNGTGLMVAAARTGQAVYAPDVRLEPRYLEGDPDTRSEVSIPLRTRERVIGVINMESPQIDAFSERDRRVLAAFAEQAALALENTRLVVSLEQAVQRANELAVAAEEASRIKSQFLTNTSHELRTPLTSVIGSLDIVLNELCSTKEEERQVLRMAAEAAHGLSLIVDDMLEIAKIEAGQVEVQLQVTAIGPFLEEVNGLNRPLAEARNLRFEIVAPDISALVYADSDKLRKILYNLVSNAIKFTEQGRVTVSASPDLSARRMVVQVQDTGIGIPVEVQSRLFQPFFQVDGSTTRRYGGTGLGLTISRRLAEMMGGTLTLYSAGAGQGTTLTLTLPLADTGNN